MINYFILAGDRKQANDFIKSQGWPRLDCFIIEYCCIPIGYHDIQVCCTGTYQSIPELHLIEMYLQASNPTYFEIQGKFRVMLQQPLRRQQGGTQTKMPIKARIWWDNSLDSYIVSSSYSSKLVDSLKQFIPSGSRDFDPTTKFWYIKEQYGEFVRQVAETAFGVGSVSFTSKNVTGQSQNGQQAYSGRPVVPTNLSSTESVIAAFFDLLPYEAAKKAYIVASATLHPDKPSGDGQKMSRLNELWQRLEKEFYKR
jgi:hypothetical protein